MSASTFPTLASEFPFPSDKVLEVLATDTIATAFNLLLEHRVLSLPVYDHKSKVYLGWFNVSDLVPVFLALDDYVKTLSSEELTNSFVLKASKGFPFEHNREAVIVGSETTMEQCFKFGICPMHKWMPFYEDSTMTNVIRSLATDDVKRVPILNKDSGKVVKIISQGAIIHFVQEQLMRLQKDPAFKLPKSFKKTAVEMNFMKTVVCVEEGLPMADALALMVKTKHTAIGIVDEDDHNLFTCVSTKDLLQFKSLENIALNRLRVEKDARDFDEGLRNSRSGRSLDLRSVQSVSKAGRALADLTVTDFVSFVRQSEIRKNSKTRAAIITIHPDATLAKMMGVMSTCKVHRLFIIDDEKKPVGVVSVRDIVRSMFAP